MTEQTMTKNVSYLLDASEHCGYDIAHWIRYLRKYIKDGVPTLEASEVEYLTKCPRLTHCQRIVLERAMEVGTPTYAYVSSLNEPARTPMLDQVRREMRDAGRL